MSDLNLIIYNWKKIGLSFVYHFYWYSNVDVYYCILCLITDIKKLFFYSTNHLHFTAYRITRHHNLSKTKIGNLKQVFQKPPGAPSRVRIPPGPPEGLGVVDGQVGQVRLG